MGCTWSRCFPKWTGPWGLSSARLPFWGGQRTGCRPSGARSWPVLSTECSKNLCPPLVYFTCPYRPIRPSRCVMDEDAIGHPTATYTGPTLTFACLSSSRPEISCIAAVARLEYPAGGQLASSDSSRASCSAQAKEPSAESPGDLPSLSITTSRRAFAAEASMQGPGSSSVPAVAPSGSCPPAPACFARVEALLVRRAGRPAEEENSHRQRRY